MVDITRHPREIIEPVWSSNSWTHNIFRVYEYWFGRRSGIRAEGAVDSKGNTYSYTWENLFAVYESLIRNSFTLPKFSIVYLPQLKLAGLSQGGVTPFRFAIAFDSTTTFDNGSGHATSFTYAHTCTGSNLTLISNGYMNEAGAPTVTSMTYNSVSMTNGVTNIAGNQNVFLYYQATPSTGANNIIITPNKSCIASFGSISFTGTNASPKGATGTNAATSTTPSTSVITTSANSWVVDSLQFDGSTGTLSPVVTGSGQTSRYTNSAFGPGSQSVGGSSMTTTSTGTYVPAWSMSASTDWQSAAMELIAGAAATVNSGFFFAVDR